LTTGLHLAASVVAEAIISRASARRVEFEDDGEPAVQRRRDPGPAG
jgi:hypothetical protein